MKNSIDSPWEAGGPPAALGKIRRGAAVYQAVLMINRPPFLLFAVLLPVVLALPGAGGEEQSNCGPLGGAAVGGGGDLPIEVLIVDGFSNHDWERTTALIRGILQSDGRFRVDVATCPANAGDPAFAAFRPRVGDFDVVLVNCNSLRNEGQWPASLRRDFVEFVHQGGGAFIFHSANNSFPGWADYDRIIGLGWRGAGDGIAVRISQEGGIQRIPAGEGRGTSHGPRGDRLVHRLGDHPIHAGLPRAWMAAMIEVYTYARGPAERLEVLSWAEDPATQMRWPVEWTVRFGAGRVYNSTFGHVWRGEVDPPGIRCAGFQTVLVRALEWLAKCPVEDRLPADFPSDACASLRPLPEAAP